MQQPHKANSKTCSLIAQAYEIEKSKVYHQQTHNEARQSVIDEMRQNSRNSSTTHQVQAEVHHAFYSQVSKQRSAPATQFAYSDVVKRSTQQNLNKTRNISTQTDECDSFEFLGRSFFDKLKYCLVELFRSSVMKENSKEQNHIIDNVLQQQFGNGTSNFPQEKREERNRKKRLPEPESDAQDDVETDLEGVISDFENPNYGDKFITVEKKQVRIPKLKLFNSEIQSEPKSVKVRGKKSRKKNN